MIHLYAIYPLDEELIYQPLCVKGDGKYSVIAAFRSADSADAFVAQELVPGEFRVAPLTLEEFDKVKATGQANHGIEVYIKIYD